MASETMTVTRPEPAHATGIELSTLGSQGGSPETQRQSNKAPIPKLRLAAAGFSFLCAGIDSATLGPLLPYIIQSFTIGTGEVAAMYVSHTFAQRFRERY
jgi:hypothetical protein